MLLLTIYPNNISVELINIQQSQTGTVHASRLPEIFKHLIGIEY